MEVGKGKEKKNFILKKLENYLSRNRQAKSSTKNMFSKSNSLNCSTAKASSKDDKRLKTKRQVAPNGCFSVYVGPEKQRFVIKTEYANHPLFKMLLEDAELEYGFNTEGPLMLPCDVDLFWKVLAEMDRGEEIDHSCGGFAYASCSPFSPARGLRRSSYSLLTPPRLLKINHF
ncbi:SAUR-like auxin-responsive protein family [Forsythia ovata]|uniref:SAUR-like auxin-responsive protein family n=1 Tax=Forsythia ovata TaxID=205694 RepID=A0ABD1TQV0_9LAMI